MTDTQKIKAIEKIISKSFEFEPSDKERKDGYFEAITIAICAIIETDQGGVEK